MDAPENSSPGLTVGAWLVTAVAATWGLLSTALATGSLYLDWQDYRFENAVRAAFLHPDVRFPSSSAVPVWLLNLGLPLEFLLFQITIGWLVIASVYAFAFGRSSARFRYLIGVGVIVGITVLSLVFRVIFKLDSPDHAFSPRSAAPLLGCDVGLMAAALAALGVAVWTFRQRR